MPNVGACHKRCFALPVTKAELTATSRAAYRSASEVSVSLQLLQLLTTSHYRDPLPNVVCYMVGYTAILHHVTII